MGKSPPLGALVMTRTLRSATFSFPRWKAIPWTPNKTTNAIISTVNARPNDGIAMNKRMTLGNMVRIISIVVPWTILCGIGLVFSLKCHKARTNIRDTKTKIRMRKKKISWCKSMIPCIIGVAASWDPNCHGSAASQRAIVRNRHDNERRIIGISHLFQLCSRKEKGKETDLDVGVGFSNETFFHEL